MKKLIVFVLMSVLLIASVQAAAYIKFDGVDGESTGRGHEGWSDLSSFSQSLEKTPRDSASGQATGKRMHAPFVITKELDKSTPKLAERSVDGSVFPFVTLEFTGRSSSPDGETESYLQIRMENVMISSWSLGGDSEPVPTEQISLNYEKIQWTYTAMDGTRHRGHVTILK